SCAIQGNPKISPVGVPATTICCGRNECRNGANQAPVPCPEAGRRVHIAASFAGRRELGGTASAGIIGIPTLMPLVHTNKNKAPDTYYRIDPLNDPRWDTLVEASKLSSVFHSRQWLEALRRTYGYESIAYTTSSPAEALRNGIVFCKVDSWLTGRRLVSLPFSDHCQPLVQDPNDCRVLAKGLQQELSEGDWCYMEARPLISGPFLEADCRTSATYCFHRLDLSPHLDTILHNLHKNSTQRKILRAQREGLAYQEGTTNVLLDEFYQLLVMTRRRHGIPPQPKNWLYNLRDCFGKALKIRVARKEGRAIAGMLTLRFKDTLFYKYGGSDTRFNRFGGMHLLYWKSIQDAKSCGLSVLDLGRTDPHQEGLIRFKNRWGAKQTGLNYFRYPALRNTSHFFDGSDVVRKMRFLKWGFANAPQSMLSLLGNLLYKHVG
ncbi:MAG: lipid II:glycine glycyltransferase FemX, partial [Nitrososphaerales archaeon]